MKQNKKKIFKFGDKVHSKFAGNSIFHSYRALDRCYMQYDANIMIPDQTETIALERGSLKKGWKKDKK